MAAYVIANIEVIDAAVYERYRREVPATIEKYGGRFLVRGGAVQALEGNVAPKRIVVLEFPKASSARRPGGIRPSIGRCSRCVQSASRGDLFFVEGV